MAFDIPEPYQTLIPPNGVTTSELLEYHLPPFRTARFHPTLQSFRAEDPNTDFLTLSNCPVPSKVDLDTLLGLRAEALTQGFKSLCVPGLPRTRFDFWVLEFWEEISPAINGQAVWDCGMTWLDRVKRRDTELSAVIAEAQGLISALSWNGPVGGFSNGAERTISFTDFLSTRWISCDLLNMMMDVLSRRVLQSSTHRDTTLIGSLVLANTLQSTYTRRETSLGRVLGHYTSMIKNNNYHRLYFPAHVDGNHWVGIAVDFRARKIYLGDSLEDRRARPRTLLDTVQWWTENHFGGQFDTDLLMAPEQSDSYSCGICVPNMFEHAIFDTPLWTTRTRECIRIRYFNQIARRHTNAVRTISPSRLLSILITYR